MYYRNHFAMVRAQNGEKEKGGATRIQLVILQENAIDAMLLRKILRSNEREKELSNLQYGHHYMKDYVSSAHVSACESVYPQDRMKHGRDGRTKGKEISRSLITRHVIHLHENDTETVPSMVVYPGFIVHSVALRELTPYLLYNIATRRCARFSQGE